MDNSEFKESFINETREYLDILNHSLLELEKSPADDRPMEEIFRRVHSLKSMAAGMGYEQISDLAHQMETVLARFRTTRDPMPGKAIDVLFDSLDLLTTLLAEVSEDTPRDLDILPLVQKLSSWAN
jgi:two-component system chemotaxis sensor kinase CheA